MPELKLAPTLKKILNVISIMAGLKLRINVALDGSWMIHHIDYRNSKMLCSALIEECINTPNKKTPEASIEFTFWYFQKQLEKEGKK